MATKRIEDRLVAAQVAIENALEEQPQYLEILGIVEPS